MRVLKAIIVAAAFLVAGENAKADQSAVSVMNELLRGELAAVTTYNQALEKIQSPTGREQLMKFKDNHQKAVSTLQAEVKNLGGTPETSAGAWGAWASAVEGSAKVVGDTAALKALKEGEEHGVKEYKELLENKNAPANIKDIVRTTLIPNQQEHIQGLDRLMDAKTS